MLADRLSEARTAHGLVRGRSEDVTSALGQERLAALTDDQLRRLPVARLSFEASQLQNELGLQEKLARKLGSQQERHRIETARLGQLERELDDATSAPQRFGELRDRRDQHYEAVFDALQDEEQILTELYSPLTSLIEGADGALSKIRFRVVRQVDVDTWAKAGEGQIDLRRNEAFYQSGALLESVDAELTETWRSGSGPEVRAALRSWLDEHTQDLVKQAKVDRTDRAAMRTWTSQLATWLFSVDHVRLTYRLEYDGVDISRLSPGTRGIVLLLLYLALDLTEDTPLIIDQPEENLDPESVFDELVGLFHEARDRRQVIIVTHNANLVVNTDADQVIVASADGRQEGELPKIRYQIGGLESSHIRQAVCRVLEGGAEAFVQRARRLRFLPVHFERNSPRSLTIWDQTGG